jgi:hypothetical protein
LTTGNELTIPVDCGIVGRGSAMKRILEWAEWVLNPFAWIVSLVGIWIASLVGKGADGLSKDYRDDPVYKKNLERLIEHHRQFEKKE